MRAPFRLTTLAAVACVSAPVFAAPDCPEIASDVKSAIGNDTAKVLMIVEDALVINETCACEIVKAAIEATGADEAMTQQIVQTAIAVAPKMAPQITACAGLESIVAPAAVPLAASEKGAKNVQPIEPVEPPPAEPDFYALPSNIRGVYLISPGGVGVITEETEVERIEPKPMSPSCAKHY